MFGVMAMVMLRVNTTQNLNVTIDLNSHNEIVDGHP